ncbi:unnamed protein product [Knipowitschia caucasica]
MSGAYSSVSDKCILDVDHTMNLRRSSGRRFKPNTAGVGLFLGILCFIMLVAILILVILNFSELSSHDSYHQRPEEADRLEFLQQQINNLTEKTEKTKNTTAGFCSSSDWIEVNRKCFYIAPFGVTRSWEKSRDDCRDRGGRLVTIQNRAKLLLLGRFYRRAWIGLSDRGIEGTWEWEDGTPLVGQTSSELWVDGEPNDADEREDCVQLTVESKKIGFNDMTCSTPYPYICETLE